MHRKAPIGCLWALIILTLGVQNPKMGGGQKSKFSDFTQNDFSGRFGRFPEKKISKK